MDIEIIVKVKETLPINPEVLKWARETAGYVLADECKQYPKFLEWESGKTYPSYSQLKKLATRYKRPLAVFFFPEPPEEEKIEKSLRALYRDDVNLLTPTVRYLFRKATAFKIYLKEIFSEDLHVQLEKVKWLNKKVDKNIHILAYDVRKHFNISLETQIKWKDSGEALEKWRDILADNGVYVFKDAFKDENISGFCIYDDHFPIIYLNNSTTKNRQIFTLFHELAHLILHQSQLDTFDDNMKNVRKDDAWYVEHQCNLFSSNFLVPDDGFIDLNMKSINDEKIEHFSKMYKVSRDVILKKLLSLNLISDKEYELKITSFRNDFDKNKENKKSAGGDFYKTRVAYLGTSYLSLILNSYYQGKIDLQKASRYLDIKPKTFTGLEDAFLNKGAKNVHI